MTEDDTFRVLKRVPYYQMMYIWSNSKLFRNEKTYTECKEEIDSLFIKHGWTVEEYTQESGN